MKPVAGVDYDSTKKKFEKNFKKEEFKDGMTLTQIKEVTLGRDVDKDAFYNKLKNL